MNSYIDIHSHILPQIDDGAENFDMSMKMLRVAYADGNKTIIVTQHYKPGRHNASPEKIYVVLEKLGQEAKKTGVEGDNDTEIGRIIHELNFGKYRGHL